ncbi:hypothetical protein [Bacillus taeanensis]|uniref:DUF2642 domain-containing protein n=1 Tax=Bacillus taeanensis TaxID=273032 RepID=A0A366Y330_9BACI|nr:hypothetical protein [Bacillus taeanensis]RBW70813.1 hypothetical protein DS031_04905 [Bacillus taeanensis]
MKKSDSKRFKSEFCCPEFVPACIDDDRFCSPFKCPEQLPQPKFSSPNSSLSPEDLEKLNECIEEANQLLLTLALEREEDNLKFLQQSFRNLKGHQVIVTFKCNEKIESIKGTVLDTGLDFIIIDKKVTFSLIPFERILAVKHRNDSARLKMDQELLKIDTCLRRAITFQFGEVVAKSPFLLNLFFGLSLNMFLESFVGCFVYVKTDTEEFEIDGTLVEVKKQSIELKVDKEKRGIDFDEICFIEIED